MNLLSFTLIFPIIAAFASLIRINFLNSAIIYVSSFSLVLVNVIIINSSPISFEITTILENYQIYLVSDKITSIYATLISILYFFTNLYSVVFLKKQHHAKIHQDLNKKIHFFFLPLSIMASLGIAYSGNLITMFIFYEILTLSTYPLVIQSFSEHARKAGKIYIITLLTSSILFLIFALIFLEQNINSAFNTNGAFTPSPPSPKEAIILLFCFVFGFSKTAIFPLYKWLPKAMVAPIPVSALLHAVAVVKSGIFALIKVFVYLFGLKYLQDLHHQIPLSLDWITLLACFTILFSGIKACMQENLKKILAYSTISQLSHMILFLSLVSQLGFALSFLQILSHSIAKITLFFSVGIIYISTKLTDVNEMQGMSRILPAPVILFILSALSILGLPPSTGWLVKNFAFHIIKPNSWINHIAIFTLIISSLLSCYYFFKPIYKMLSPGANLNSIHYKKINSLTLITSVTYSLAVILFYYWNNIINIINA